MLINDDANDDDEWFSLTDRPSVSVRARFSDESIWILEIMHYTE
jgi:hypothetical protein